MHTVYPEIGASCRVVDQHGLAVQHMAVCRHSHRRRHGHRPSRKSFELDATCALVSMKVQNVGRGQGGLKSFRIRRCSASLEGLNIRSEECCS